METCIRCGRNEEEVKLFDGFYINEPVKICEKCSLISHMPIVKRPSSAQLKNSERAFGVRQRLEFMTGLSSELKKEKTLKEEMKNLQEVPELEKPEDLVFKLVDNFHWVIQTSRRRKGFTIKQMADSIGESESALKMLEKGIIPANSIGLIEKIEQFLNIRLVKRDYYDKIKAEAMKPEEKIIVIHKKFLDNPEEHPLGIVEKAPEERDFIRKIKEEEEEANDMITEAIREERNPIARRSEAIENTPLKINNFKRDNLMGIKIADLKRIEENAEKDFEIEHLKTKDEIGREQMEDFGKEDTEKLKRRVFREEYSETRKKKAVPSIYDLMKNKEEKEKKSLIGKDIQIEKSESTSSENDVINRDSANDLEDTSSVMKKKTSLFSKLKKTFGINEPEEKVDFETGKVIRYED